MKLHLPNFSDKPMEFALLIGVAVAGVLLLHNAIKNDIKGAAGAIGTGAQALGEAAGGIISGHNTITAGTDYDGAGVFGTLGAATDAASGGFFDQLGTWIGDKVFDVTHPESNTDFNPSSAIQSSTNKPYAAGPSSEYADAVDNSPTQAAAVISPWAIWN